MKNHFCRASVKFDCPKSFFDSLELVTMREYNDFNGGTYIEEIKTATDLLENTDFYDEPFYRIFGVMKNTSPKKQKFIADFYNISDARDFLSFLTGEDIHIISY